MINYWPLLGILLVSSVVVVLVNLAVNSRDAMPEGGAISIVAENLQVQPTDALARDGVSPGAYVLIKVADTGTGIPPEIFDKIFEPFFTPKPVGQGTGLGLSTVLGIVKSHGGFLQVQTEEKKGSTFLIFLPATNAGETEFEEAKFAEAPKGNGELILVVDDETSGRARTQEALESFGYRVVTAEDGAEAVAVAVLVDRSAGQARFDVPAISLLELSFPTYPADQLPPELAAIPAIKPGS